MTTGTHPLSGLRLAISASEAVDEAGYGLTSRELSRAIRKVAEAILGQGGRLAFGHDWRSQGVMEEILDFAISHKPVAPVSLEAEPLITNYVPWPDRTTVSEEDRVRYSATLRIVECWPKHQERFGAPRPGAAHMASRAAALTLMRWEMTGACDARLCFGGRSSGSQGRYAGIAEEAALSLEMGRPLYVTSLFGGASARVIDALLGATDGETPAFLPDPAVRASLSEFDPMPRTAVDPGIFARVGVEGLAFRNKLSVEENRRLFEARHLAEVIGLLLVGLARVARARG